jgi:hypothetical protein
MSAGRYDILFEPVTIGPKIAPNRFWQTPHAGGTCSRIAESWCSTAISSP